MANLKTKRLWDEAWKKLSVFFSPNGQIESPFGQDGVEIDEPLTLYVETTGSDSGTGSIGQPFKTPQAALDWLKGKALLDLVTINIGIGSFPGFTINCNDLSFGRIGKLSINGTFVSAVLTTGTASGTGTSAVVDGAVVLTDNTQNWTVNELRGKFLLSSGVYIPIASNTATAITLTSSSGSVTTYSLWEHGTKIDSGSQTMFYGASGTGICRVGIYGGLVASSNTGVEITNMQIESTGLSANQATFSCRGHSASITLTSVSFVRTSATANTLLSIAGASEVQTIRCSFIHPDTTNSTSVSMSGRSFAPLNCYFYRGATGFTTTTTAQAYLSFSIGSTFDSCTTGLTLIGSSAVLQSTGPMRFLGCTTAITMGTSSSDSGRMANNPTGIHTAFFSGCTTCLTVFRGFATLGACTGTGNTNGIVASLGARVQIAATATLGASTELSVDGATGTLATLRGNSPKVFPLTPNAYGTYIYE